VRSNLASLPYWRRVCKLAVQIHAWIASKLDDQPGLLGWLWRLFHVREWQKSAAQSATFWLLCTLVIYNLVARLGNGWQVNVAVSLTLDGITYAINKLWIWPRRKVSIAKSGGRNLTTWGIFFAINGLLAWLLMGHADVGTVQARCILACYGVAINPLVFVIRDKMIFNQTSVRTLLQAGWHVIQTTVKT
jgi:hypothetical protein